MSEMLGSLTQQVVDQTVMEAGGWVLAGLGRSQNQWLRQREPERTQVGDLCTRVQSKGDL